MPEVAQEMVRPGCVLCEFVMYRLKEWLQDDHTQEDIQEGLHRVCMTAPDSLKVRELVVCNASFHRTFILMHEQDQCQNLVDIYGPAIIQLMIEGVEPKEVCTKIGVCVRDEPEVSGHVLEARNDDSNCANCQYVLAIVMDCE